MVTENFYLYFLTYCKALPQKEIFIGSLEASNPIACIRNTPFAQKKTVSRVSSHPKTMMCKFMSGIVSFFRIAQNWWSVNWLNALNI